MCNLYTLYCGFVKMDWKKELGIPAEMTAFAPIIVGIPSGETPPVPRKQPEILTWK